MKKNIGILITTLIIGGCASTEVDKEYSHLSVTHNEIQSSK